MTASWTIQELRQQVEERLADDDAPANGQVRAVPDERSIRYYTTLGLLDRPTLRGRTALYRPRHLAQLVAIKRFQSEGKTLAEIQVLLPAMDDHALARLSGIAIETKAPRAGSRRDFWREPVVVVEAEPAPESESESEPEPEPEPESDSPIPRLPTPAPVSPPPVSPPPAPVSPSAVSLLELHLAPGVRLAFHATRPATDADAHALLTAATPLLAELLRRHLITPATTPSNPNTSPTRSLEDPP